MEQINLFCTIAFAMYLTSVLACCYLVKNYGLNAWEYSCSFIKNLKFLYFIVYHSMMEKNTVFLTFE